MQPIIIMFQTTSYFPSSGEVSILSAKLSLANSINKIE